MEYTMEEKYLKIKNDIIGCTSKSPVIIAKEIMAKDYISMHGPEHHFLDGAAFIVAYKNAGGMLDLDYALDSLAKRTIKMPGGMCGGWGVCGAVTGVGAALSVINRISPLTDADMYGENMAHTSQAVFEMSKIGGPRCCKRNAYITLTNGARFVSQKYGVKMELDSIACEYSSKNPQCIMTKCPFFKNK